jgi:hypothetical protein
VFRLRQEGTQEVRKENGSATEAPKEKAASKANIVKVDPEPAATYSESMDFLLLLRDKSEVEEEQQAMLRRSKAVKVDEIRESVATDRYDNTTV